MLVVLEQRGYLVNEPGTDRFRLTLKLFELAHRFAPIRRLTTAAEPIMSQLSDSIEQSCHLVVYYEGRGRVVAQQDSPSLRSFSVRLGADAPLVNTCSGHLLLAFAHPATRRTMLERIPKHHPQPGKRELESVYRRVVENGYERLVSDQVFGVEDVGYPVFNHAGKVTAALVVPFLSYLDDSHSVKIDAAREFIHEAALELSADLGHSSSQAALGALSSR